MDEKENDAKPQKPVVEITSRKMIEIIKAILIVLLFVIEIVICADAYGKVQPHDYFYIALGCCVVLLGLEALNTFVF